MSTYEAHFCHFGEKGLFFCTVCIFAPEKEGCFGEIFGRVPYLQIENNLLQYHQSNAKANSECRIQNAVSRQKQLSVVFVVANAQKQGVIGARLVLASSTTMFQVLVQSAELVQNSDSAEEKV